MLLIKTFFLALTSYLVGRYTNGWVNLWKWKKRKIVLWPYNLTNLNKIDVDYKNVKIYIFNNGIINNICSNFTN